MNHTFRALVVFALGLPALAAAEPPKSETISTPSGSVTTTTKTVDPAPQQVVTASAAELRAFIEFAGRAQAFVAAYLGTRATLSLDTLDEAFRIWQQETRRRFTDQEVVDILGSYLGGKLVAELDMEWVVVKDQYGTDYGVRSRKVELLAYPFASVEKRIQRSEHGFMAAVFHAIDHSLKTGDHKPRQP
jgi:Domain of unknown function (DUF3806)